MKNQRKSHNKKENEAMKKAMEVGNLQNSKTDPQGSYTGTPVNPYEEPVQDADDL